MKHVSFYISAFIFGSLGLSSVGYARTSAKHSKARQAHPVVSSRHYVRHSNHAEKLLHASPVHLNTASVQQLQSLKGIGAAKAEQLVAYRAQHGTFASLDDITKVKGFNAGLYQKIMTNNKGRLSL